MAETNGNGEANQPSLNVLVQYTKDFSFENPHAPRSLAPQEKAPNIAIQVNVNARPLSDEDFEASILMEGQAGEGEDLLFKFELNYAGVFRIRGIPQEHIHQVVMIECPRLLFPFARNIVADAVRGGGFPPLYVDPIDFAALYQQRIAEMQASAKNS